MSLFVFERDSFDQLSLNSFNERVALVKEKCWSREPRTETPPPPEGLLWRRGSLFSICGVRNDVYKGDNDLVSGIVGYW